MNEVTRKKLQPLASLLASSLFMSTAVLATPEVSVAAPVAAVVPKAETKPKARVTPNKAARDWAKRESDYIRKTWGIEIVGVHPIASGYMLEFRYHVIDPVKSKPLTDKMQKPLLYDEASNATLSVPTMDKVGEVRQTAAQEANRSYYMIFGNPGKIVKPGNRVSIIVGKFRADGIIVN